MNIMLSGITNNFLTEWVKQQKIYKKLLRQMMDLNNILTLNYTTYYK